MEERRHGVTLTRDTAGVRVSSNRRSRVLINADGIEPVILRAANPGDWHPSVTLPLPTGTMTCVPEAEGPQGPRPTYRGPFEPDDARTFTFHIPE